MFLLKSKIFWEYCTEKDTNTSGSRYKHWESEILKAKGKNLHPVRLKQSILSRLALDKICEQKKEIFNQSFTHTDLIGLVAVSSEKPLYVGIDVENKKREIKPEIEKHFINEKDCSLSQLELWCIKEAAYKCLSNAHNIQTTLSKIVVQENYFHFEGYKGEWYLDTLKIEDQEYIVAITTLDHLKA